MATETRTVTTEDRMVAGVIVVLTIGDMKSMTDKEFERRRTDMMEELLWTRSGRERVRRFLLQVAATPPPDVGDTAAEDLGAKLLAGRWPSRG